jgi:hypothetical protein
MWGKAPWGAASMWGVSQLVMYHVEKRYVQSHSISVKRFPALAAAFTALSFGKFLKCMVFLLFNQTS